MSVHTFNSSHPDEISERFIRVIPRISAKWNDSVRLEFSRYPHDPSLLENLLPQFFNKLSSKLAQRKSKSEIRPQLSFEDQRSARRILSAQSLSQMLVGYHLLRNVIFDVLEESGAIDDADRHLILEIFRLETVTLTQSFVRFSSEFDYAKFEADIAHLKMEQNTRDQFVLTLAHDLRTPLAAAKISAQLIPHRLEQPELILKLAAKVNRDLERIDHMIKDILDLSQVRNGQSLPLQLASLNLNSVILTVIDELSQTHGDRFVCEGENVEGFWCENFLRRALENLLDNAVKYGCSDVPISIHIQSDGHQVAILVHNEGEPIAPDQVKSLFQPYFRSPQAEMSGKTGWGMGLALVESVAEAHGGQVKVESSLLGGTTFTLSLPKDARPYQKNHDDYATTLVQM